MPIKLGAAVMGRHKSENPKTTAMVLGFGVTVKIESGDLLCRNF